MIPDKIYHESKCSICFEEYDEDEKKNECIINKCGHVFHTVCVNDWLVNNPNCPICREGMAILDTKIIVKHAAKDGISAAKEAMIQMMCFIVIFGIVGMVGVIGGALIGKILTIWNLRPSFGEPFTPEEIEYTKMLGEKIANQSLTPSIKGWAILITSIALIALAIGVIKSVVSFTASYLERRKENTAKKFLYKPEAPI